MRPERIPPYFYLLLLVLLATVLLLFTEHTMVTHEAKAATPSAIRELVSPFRLFS